MLDVKNVDLERLRTLILNADMQPQDIFPLYCKPAKDAIIDVLEEKAIVVAEYDRPVLHDKLNMNWPSVIMYREYHHWEKRVPLTHETLYYRDGGSCSYCGIELHGIQEVTMDHVVPQSKGGGHDWINIVCACSECNNKKGSREPTGQWKPKRNPFEPDIWFIRNQRKRFPIIVDDEAWKNFLVGWKAEVRVR